MIDAEQSLYRNIDAAQVRCDESEGVEADGAGKGAEVECFEILPLTRPRSTDFAIIPKQRSALGVEVYATDGISVVNDWAVLWGGGGGE